LYSLIHFSKCFILLLCQALNLYFFIPFLIVKRNYRFKFSNFDLLFLSLFSFLLTLKFFYHELPFWSFILNLRFFFGSIFLFYFFSIFNISLKILCISYILINYYELFSLFFFNDYPDFISNYFSTHSIYALERGSISGSFFRLYGPFLNSSLNGTFSIILLLFINLYKNNYTFLLKLFLSFSFLFIFIYSFSSSAILVALFCFLYYIFAKKSIIVPVFLLSLMFFFILLFNFDELRGIPYIFKVFVTKYFQFITHFNFKYIFFGNPKFSFLNATGDFLLLDFLNAHGIISILVLTLFLFSKSRGLFVIISLFMLSCIHYGTLFNLTGQIFFAVLLSNIHYSYSKSFNS
jgi:hypothetical protein